MRLRLKVRDYADPAHWRWVLYEGDRRVGGHIVSLDATCWQYEALTDLPFYLSWHVAPDRRAEDEARILKELGSWIGTEILGPLGDRLASHKGLVQIEISKQARELLFLPIELARVRGRLLGLSHASFTRELARPLSRGEVLERRDVPAAASGLRVLGLFSLPAGTQPLNLRRERQTLVQTVARIESLGGDAEVQVLQYGATRERVQEVLADPAGWDVVHISGHGTAGELLLEQENGDRDRMSVHDLAASLYAARDRLKLVTISACWSATPGDPASSSLGAAGLAKLTPRHAPPPGRGDNSAGDLAAALAGRLPSCAVLATRYPVSDEFAADLVAGLYDRLLGKGRPIPLALSQVLRELTGANSSPAGPGLALFSPLIFGSNAAAIFPVPVSEPSSSRERIGSGKMAGFPPPPERLVGRTAVLARASAALAPASGVPGVLLVGMPGAGKTTCALELAYTHEDAFHLLIWYSAPAEGSDTTKALTEFIVRLDWALPELKLLNALASTNRFRGILPSLSERIARSRILIVIDNVESLLSEHGAWSDSRWALLISALCAVPDGLSKVVLTSRRAPDDILSLFIQPLDPLPPDEAYLLALELPRLRALIRGEMPGIEPEAARRLAVSVLNVAQGHPLALEFADSLAARPDRLAAQLQAIELVWRHDGEQVNISSNQERRLADDPFAAPDSVDLFSGLPADEQPSPAAEYEQRLGAWTRSVAGELPPAGDTLLRLLCCLADHERIRPAVAYIWPELWNRIGFQGDAPDMADPLRVLASRGLVSVVESGDTGEEYEIHPAVVAASRAETEEAFQRETDKLAAAYWTAVMRYVAERESSAQGTSVVVLAGLSAAPHLIRLGELRSAAAALEEAIDRAPSPDTAALALPLIRWIVDSGEVPGATFVLAKVLEVTDPDDAEQELRRLLDGALARDDQTTTSLACAYLSDLLRAMGRLSEALNLAQRTARHAALAGLGPWTQLAAEGRILQIFSAMGQFDRVVATARSLIDRMAELPDRPDQPETAVAWNVRETVLDTARNAAVQLGSLDEALAFNAAIGSSMRARGATSGEQARARFNDYLPLMSMGRYVQAIDTLVDCRAAMEDADDIQGLGRVMSALAAVEDSRGAGEAAIRFERDALRYKYLAGDVLSVAVSMSNLGGYLRLNAREPKSALGHHLAAAMIFALCDAGPIERTVAEAALDVRNASPGKPPRRGLIEEAAALFIIPDAVRPTTSLAAGIHDRLDDVFTMPGTDIRALLASLSPDHGRIVSTARQLTEDIGNAVDRGYQRQSAGGEFGDYERETIADQHADLSPLTRSIGSMFEHDLAPSRQSGESELDAEVANLRNYVSDE